MEANVWHKQHWSVAVTSYLRRWYFVAVSLIVLATLGEWYLPSILFLVASLIGVLVRHHGIQYMLNKDTIVIKNGIVSTKTNTVPFERIQAINQVQDPLQRWLRIFSLEFQISGVSTEDVTLHGIGFDALQELQIRLHDFAETHVLNLDIDSLSLSSRNAIEESKESISFKMGIVDCLKLACIRNSVLTVLVGFIVFLQQRLDAYFWEVVDFSIRSIYLGELLDWEIYFENIGTIAERFPWVVLAPNPEIDWTPLLMILLLLLGGFVLSYVVVSSIVMFFIYYRFQMNLTDTSISLKSGSLLKLARTHSLDKIQYTRTVRTIRHRVLGAESVYFNTSSSSSADGFMRGMLSNWLIPLGRPRTTQSVLKKLYARYSFENESWQGVVSSSWKRRFKKLLFATLPVFVVLTLISPWALALAAGVVIFLAYEARKYVKYLGYRVTADTIQLRRGWRVRYEHVIPLVKIQNVTLKQTYFDKGHQVCTLCIDTYKDSAKGYTASLPYVSMHAAREVAQTINQHMKVHAYDG